MTLILRLRLAVIVVLVCVNSGCKETNNNSAAKVETQELKVFNGDASSLQYDIASEEEKWHILARIAGATYKNKLEAKDWIEHHLAKKLKNPEGLTQKILKALNEDLYFNNYDEPSVKLSYFTLYSKIGKENFNDYAMPYLSLSNYFVRRQELDSIIKYNDIIKTYIDKDTLEIVPIIYYGNQAVIEGKKGNYFQAVINYNKALEATPKSDNNNLSILYHDLALMYLNLEFFNRSFDYMDMSLKYKKMDELPLNSLNSIGVIYSKSNNFIKADSIFKKVIDKALAQEEIVVLASSYANYGNLNRKMKRFDRAITYMEKSDSICKDIGLDFGITINYINRSEVYFDQGMHEKAATEIEKGRETIEAINNLKINKEFYKLYYRIQDSLGNNNAANKYYRLYNENKNRYFGDLSKTVITEWELQNQRNESLKQQAKYELNIEKKNRNLFLMLFLFMIILLVIITIYVIIFKRNIRDKEKLKIEKQKIAHELELKSKELLADALKNVSISTTKQAIYKELQQIIEKLPKKHQPKIKSLAKKMQQSNDTRILEEFNKRFTGVYDDFYIKLKEMAPELSQSELNICALISLNLTSKEIALLTNRTVGTVENIRINIRKKLNFNPELNLQESLISLK